MKWFRMYTDTISDIKIRRLPPAQRWLWIAVLTLARMSPTPGTLILSDDGCDVTVTSQDLADASHISLEDTESGINAFLGMNMLSVNSDGAYVVTHWDKRQFSSDDGSKERTKRYRERKRDESVTSQKRHGDNDSDVTVTVPDTDTETYINKKDHVHSASEYTSDFETFWSAYPKKLSKKAAFKNWSARIKSGVNPELLIQCAVNYAELCRQQKTEDKFIKHPTTFLSNTESYADYETIEVEKPETVERPKFTRDGVPLTLSRHAREAMLEDERQRLSNV